MVVEEVAEVLLMVEVLLVPRTFKLVSGLVAVTELEDDEGLEVSLDRVGLPDALNATYVPIPAATTITTKITMTSEVATALL